MGLAHSKNLPSHSGA